MKPFPSILFIFAVGALAAHAELPADWSTNYDAALATAATNQRPALVYFTASWCEPCKLMTRLTLTDPTVAQTLSNVEHVAVNIDEHADLASARGISAVPTFVMLSPGGDEADRTTGFQPVGDFLQWLTNGMSEAREAAIRQALCRQVLAEVDQLLVATGANSAHLAALKLFDLCAVRDGDIVLAATARLKNLAAHDPAALLDGLNDSRLAVRIEAANTLRLAIGDSFDVDPWGNTADRGKAINHLREKLAKAFDSGNASQTSLRPRLWVSWA
jgi:thioredoxin-like negative regulator of GroEL